MYEDLLAVLLTGVGYIGSALATRLIAEGEHVVGIDNFFSTPRAPVLGLARHPRFSLIEGTITDPGVLARAFATADIETTYHLAANASAHPDAAPIAYTEDTNFRGTWRVLEACAAHGVARIVLASSTRLYRTPLPARIDENSPIHAEDLVHLSQLYGEVLLATQLRTSRSHMTGVAARLGIVHGVGPVMKTEPLFLAVPQRLCLAVVQGEPLTVAHGARTVLPFVHLDDAVDGLLRCRSYDGEARVVNVAAEIRSVASVAEAVCTAASARGISVSRHSIGRHPTYRTRQIHSALAPTGFLASRRIEDSVGEVLDHYRNVVAGGDA